MRYVGTVRVGNLVYDIPIDFRYLNFLHYAQNSDIYFQHTEAIVYKNGKILAIEKYRSTELRRSSTHSEKQELIVDTNP